MTYESTSGRRRLAALLGIVPVGKVAVALSLGAVCGEGLGDQAFALFAGPFVVAAGTAYILRDARVPVVKPVTAGGSTLAVASG